ncbi:hypothetical protein [Legionella yabuuchiae]|uniref:hypothetical protein n=1 Tax=Legionella yabuuchiae TaxID=376727 RepID=UPI0013EF9ECE|nr:hypothetical protein [Legionella yabuuchiae]
MNENMMGRFLDSLYEQGVSELYQGTLQRLRERGVLENDTLVRNESCTKPIVSPYLES